MKVAYPVILTPIKDGFDVFIPDFDENTQGETLEEALEMAKDAIGWLAIDLEDDGKKLPNSTHTKQLKVKPKELIKLVRVDLDDYRWQIENRLNEETQHG